MPMKDVFILVSSVSNCNLVFVVRHILSSFKDVEGFSLKKPISS